MLFLTEPSRVLESRFVITEDGAYFRPIARGKNVPTTMDILAQLHIPECQVALETNDTGRDAHQAVVISFSPTTGAGTIRRLDPIAVTTITDIL